MSDPTPTRVTVLGAPETLYEFPEGTVTLSAPALRASVRHLPPTLEDRTRGRTRMEVVVDGWRFEVLVEPATRAALRDRAERAAAGSGPPGPVSLKAQIPGRVVSVAVGEGDGVVAGQRLLSIEAMKMENEVRSPRAGTIERIAVEGGTRVELGDELLVLV